MILLLCHRQHPALVPSSPAGLVPLPLDTPKFIFDIIDGVPRGRITLGVLGRHKPGPECLVIRVLRNLIDDNLLPIVGNFEDDVLGLSPAQSKAVESLDAVIFDRDPMISNDQCPRRST
jgi:hypothetical protein